MISTLLLAMLITDRGTMSKNEHMDQIEEKSNS